MMKIRGKMKMMTTMGELLQSCPDPQFAGPLEQEWKTATLHCKLHFTAIIISIGTIVIAINIIFSSICPHRLRKHQKSKSSPAASLSSSRKTSSSLHSCRHKKLWTSPSSSPLGKPSREKSAVFLNIVQKAFDPPPLSFEHHAEFAVSAGSENLI